MYVLGLYSDGDYFKVSLISKKRGKTRLEFIREFKKDVTNLNTLKKILDKKVSFLGSGIEVVSSLPTEEIFIKKIAFPVTGKRKILKALKFRLSSDEVYSDEDRCFVPMFNSKDGETEVTLYGYTKEAMDGHIQDIKTLGIDSEWISTISRGLERFVNFFAPTTRPFFLFHLGWETSSFYLFSNGEIKREVSFKLGLKNIVDAVQKDHGVIENVDMQKMQDLFIQSIESEKINTSTSIFFEMEKEISRGWTFIVEEEAIAAEVSLVLFTGYSELSRELKPFLPSIDFEEILITPHLEYSSTQITSYAIEIGLALDRIVSDEKTLQLGEGKCIPFAQQKKAKKLLYQYTTLSLITGFFVFCVFEAMFMKKRAEFKNRYEHAVAEIEAYSNLKVKDTFNDLRETRKKLEKAVKQQKERNKVEEGKVPFAAIMEWIDMIKVEGFIIENLEYTVIQDPLEGFIVELVFILEKPEDPEKSDFFMNWAQNPIHGMVFDTSPEIEESEKNIIYKVRLKS